MPTKEYYRTHRDELIQKAVIWAQNNPDKRKATCKRYYEKADKDAIYRGQVKYRKDNPKKYLFAHARRRAKIRGQEFSITLDDLPEIPKECPLLGLEINSWAEEQSHHPSIDRIDNSKGYVPGNVWFISHRANVLKNSATVDEMLCLVCNWLKIERKNEREV